MKVLIADDSRIIRDRLKDMLSEIPEIEIIVPAKDGLEATSLLEMHKPDVAILDIRMPKKNGIDILKDIKRRNLAQWVIMLTNNPYPQFLIQSLKIGANHFFDKSTQFEMIPTALDKFNKQLKNPSNPQMEDI